LLLDINAQIGAVMASYTTGTAQRYSGDDTRAFSLIIDRFYLEHPGFCPVTNGFMISATGKTAVTFATDEDGSEVRALVYDLSSRPNFSFVFLRGFSRNKLPVTPCRRV
jgi:hypothetical protein